MDIPFYDDIYRSPIRRLPDDLYSPSWPHCGWHDSHPIPAFALETEKTVDIVDAKGDIRYKVVLSSTEIENGLRGYKVEVVHFYATDPTAGQVIMRIPEKGYEIDYREAQRAFDQFVKRYRALIVSEVADFRDVEVYKDRIDYKKTHPNCCQFCEWSRPCHASKHHCGQSWQLECHNPANYQAFTPFLDEPPFANCGKQQSHRYCKQADGWSKLPWQKEPPILTRDRSMEPIYPRVEPFGICKNFAPLKRKDNEKPLPPPPMPSHIAKSYETPLPQQASSNENTQRLGASSSIGGANREIDKLRKECDSLREDVDNYLMKISELSFENASLVCELDQTKKQKSSSKK